MAEQWYQLTPEVTLEKLRTSENSGLDPGEAESRLERFGPNKLAEAGRLSLWSMFLGQFKDFMVLILLAATVISGFLHEWADAVTIMVILTLNAILGVVQEFRAERSIEALKQLTAPEARVIRGGKEQKVQATSLVPGDLVLLEAGDRVPADLRLIKAVNLEVEESALTGESVPVKKLTEAICGLVSPGDARNILFMGTAISRGRARGVVINTGMSTEMGQIAGLIQEAGQEITPLQRRLGQMGRGLVAFCLAVCAVVVVLGIYRGEPAYHMFMAGVSLAVAAIPEGLPAIVTIALAVGVQRMIRRNAIIRKLPAVETLGCATVICSDKTGTLTQNEMTVRQVMVGGARIEVTGEGYDPKGKFITGGHRPGPEMDLLLRAAALCNNASLSRGKVGISGLFRGGRGAVEKLWHVSGDPTEGALLVMAAKSGLWREQLEKKEQRVAEIPFDSDRKRMAVVYRNDSGVLTAYLKGAPDVVLNLCSHVLQNGRRVVLTEQRREEILAENVRLAGKALRVLALAIRDLPGQEDCDREDVVEREMTFLGLAGMIDPPRPAAVTAVRTCRRAGIKVIMITGDHQVTATAVGRELGLVEKGGEVLTGTQLDVMDDQQLRDSADQVTVFARVSPKHKLRIVRALKQSGHVVAMTGDGVNDAPAVKEADIGIAMGLSGTDVTKEASSMVLADDNFKTIVAAVEEGRGIYDNIRKFIRYLLSCNVGEVLVMFLAVLAGLPLPLVPIQILWMNLVTDGLPAMALGVDPLDKDIMKRRPRNPGESIFAGGMAARILGSGSVIAMGTLGVFAGSYFTSGQDLELARTMAFNTLVFMQLFFVFTCRSEHHSILEVGFWSNPHLILAVLASAALQLAVTYLPFLQPIFYTVALSPFQWGVVMLVAVTPLLVGTALHHLRQRAGEKIMYLRV